MDSKIDYIKTKNKTKQKNILKNTKQWRQKSFCESATFPLLHIDLKCFRAADRIQVRWGLQTEHLSAENFKARSWKEVTTHIDWGHDVKSSGLMLEGNAWTVWLLESSEESTLWVNYLNDSANGAVIGSRQGCMAKQSNFSLLQKILPLKGEILVTGAPAHTRWWHITPMGKCSPHTQGQRGKNVSKKQ